MSKRAKISPCPQHASGACPSPAYLLRTCPDCMKWLGGHPKAASLVTYGVPGRRPYRVAKSALPGAYWG